MTPNANPDDDKKGPKKPDGGDEKAVAGDLSGATPEDASKPLDLSKLGFGPRVGRDEAELTPVPERPNRPQSLADIVLTDDEAADEQLELAQHRLMGKRLGIVPCDFERSKMVEGPPLTPDDYADILNFCRGKFKRYEPESDRIEGNIGRFLNWHDAYLEGLIVHLKEWGERFRNKN